MSDATDREHDQQEYRDERGIITIVVTRPRCPECGSLDHRLQRSDDNGDGTRTQHRKCGCECRFRICLE